MFSLCCVFQVFHVWFQYATRCHHCALIGSCVISLSERMEDITYSSEWEQDWVGLDKDQLLEFLKSSDLIIKDEFELWAAVLKWLQARTHLGDFKSRRPYKCLILYLMCLSARL